MFSVRPIGQKLVHKGCTLTEPHRNHAGAAPLIPVGRASVAYQAAGGGRRCQTSIVPQRRPHFHPASSNHRGLRSLIQVGRSCGDTPAAGRGRRPRISVRIWRPHFSGLETLAAFDRCIASVADLSPEEQAAGCDRWRITPPAAPSRFNQPRSSSSGQHAKRSRALAPARHRSRV